jgi:RHS repeat-associated protein
VTGTGQPPAYYGYAVNGTGLLATVYAGGSADKSNGWSETQSDWLGRTKKYSAPAYGWSLTNTSAVVDIASIYDTTLGTLTKQTTTYRADSTALSPDKFFTYAADGQLLNEGMDIDGSGTLTAASNDRIVVHDSGYLQDTGLSWWSYDKTSTYPSASSSTLTQISLTQGRLTGFSTSTVAQSVRTDANGRKTNTTTTVSPLSKQTTITATFDGASNSATQTTQNGYDFASTALTGESIQRSYDGKGRLTSVYSRPTSSTTWGATDSLTYYGDTKYLATQLSAGVTTNYGYSWGTGSRTVLATDAGGSTYVEYNVMDLPRHTYGSGATPTEMLYDTRGRRTSLATWRSGDFTAATWPASPAAGDTTGWTMDAATGLITRKTYADANHVDYTYTALGQVKTRVWARTGSVTTTYDYYDASNSSTDVSHNTRELKSMTYSDGTPTVVYTYKRSGMPAGVSDLTGSRVVAYDPSDLFEPLTETLGAYYGSRVRTFSYDSVRRCTGFGLGTSTTAAADLSQTADYTSDSGLLSHVYTATTGITSASQTFTYGYVATSGRVDNYAASSFKASYDYDGTSAARRNKVEGLWGTTSLTRFDLSFDTRGFVQAAKQSGSAFADYYPTGQTSTYNFHTYDAQGQLQASAMFRGTPPTSGAPASTDQLPGRRFQFTYDETGNRTMSGEVDPNDTTVTAAAKAVVNDIYTLKANGLNQYDTKQNQTVRVLGTAAANANVAAQSSPGGYVPVSKTDRSFAADVQPPNNAAGPAIGNLTVFAAIPGTGGAPDTVRTLNPARNWQIAKQLQSFSYDEDGNLTTDGVWTYDYDAENRLIRMTATGAAVSAGLPNQKLEFNYDYMGRRVAKSVFAGTGPTGSVSWTLSNQHRFLYDGWNVIAEFDAPGGTSCGSLLRSFTWGLDLAGSSSATGGVGALLQIADSTGNSYFPTYDGNGNVSTLVDSSNGTLAAIYEYSPFGELLRAEGSYAVSNPFRFSTKWTDSESGLSYYGLRYYNAGLGRFINRDPIAEAGGLNLYGFVGNNPINGVDVLGMVDCDLPEVEEVTKNGDCITVTMRQNCHDGGVKRKTYTVCGGADVVTLPRFETHDSRLTAGQLSLIDYGINSLIPVPDSSVATINPGQLRFNLPGRAPNNADKCKQLAARLAQAQSIQGRYDGYFSKDGQYSGFQGALGGLDPSDVAGVVSALTSLGAGARAEFLLNTIDRTGISLDRGMTLFPNSAKPWSKLAAVGAVVGVGADGFSLGDHLANGEWSGVPLDAGNIAADFYTLAAFTPGVGVGVAIGQLGVNATLAAYKFSAAREDLGNTFLSAASAKGTQQASASKVANLKQQMAANGCK